MDEKGLWRGVRPASELLILEPFPKGDDSPNEALEERFESLQRLVTRVRNIRANARLTESVRLRVQLKALDDDFRQLVKATSAVVCRLANLEAIEPVNQRPEGVVTSVDPCFELYVDLGKHVDLEAEVSRIDKEMTAVTKKLDRITRKLINPEFLGNAPAEVVEREKAKDRELKQMLQKLEALRKEYASGAPG
jgi:valyl-tRNA synthetase